VIDGLRLQIPYQELRQHCLDRAEYHKGRADLKEKELPKLKEAMEAIKQATLQSPSNLAHMNKMSATYNLNPGDTVEELEKDIREHRNKAEVFIYFANHLFPYDYNLNESDLRRLEIVR